MIQSTSSTDGEVRPDHLRLGQLLRQRQLISEQQLQQALQLQQAQGVRLGEALLTLGFISKQQLNRVLRRQRWLTPCAACIVMLSPVSMVWAESADELPDSGFSQDWVEPNRWSYAEQERLGERSKPIDILSFMALSGWDIYQGEPEAGDLKFSLKQHNDDVYSLQLSMRF